MYSVKLSLNFSNGKEKFKGKPIPPVFGNITVNEIFEDEAEILSGEGATGKVSESYIPEFTKFFNNLNMDQIFSALRASFNSAPVFSNGDVVITIGTKDMDVFEDIIPRSEYIRTSDEYYIRQYKSKLAQHLPLLTNSFK